MAMAHRPPAPSGGPRRYVSRHAVERLRARAEVPAHLSDLELARVVDDAVSAALEAAEPLEFVDSDGDRARAVELRFDGLTVRRGAVWALLKPNSLPGSDPAREAVVTLLARRPTEARAGPGAPARGVEKPFNPALAEALRGLELPGPGDSALVPPDPPADGECPAYLREAEIAVSGSALRERDRGAAEAREFIDSLEESDPRRPANAPYWDDPALSPSALPDAGAAPPAAEYVLLPRSDFANLNAFDRAEALARLGVDPELVLLRVVPFRVRVELDDGEDPR